MTPIYFNIYHDFSLSASDRSDQGDSLRRALLPSLISPYEGPETWVTEVRTVAWFTERQQYNGPKTSFSSTLLRDESWVASELKTLELINIWSYLSSRLEQFIFFFFFFSTTQPIRSFLALARSAIARSPIAGPMVAYHSLLGEGKHVKVCDRRQMLALPLSRRVSASKGCQCAAQTLTPNLKKKKREGERGREGGGEREAGSICCLVYSVFFFFYTF